MHIVKTRISALLLGPLLLSSCAVTAIKPRQVDWTSIRPSEVILKGSLVGYDAPEPAFITTFKTWSYDRARDTLDALDAARPAGVLLPEATTLSWVESGTLTELKEISFPAGQAIALNVACVGGCRMQSSVTWNENRWFSPTQKLASFEGKLNSGQVVQMRFATPPEQPVRLNLRLSDCLVMLGKCAYAISSISGP